MRCLDDLRGLRDLENFTVVGLLSTLGILRVLRDDKPVTEYLPFSIREFYGLRNLLIDLHVLPFTDILFMASSYFCKRGVIRELFIGDLAFLISDYFFSFYVSIVGDVLRVYL